MLTRIKEIYAYRDMIFNLVRRELRGRYKGSVLGFLWTYINPLCQVVVYSVVFSVIFRVNIDKFYLYLIIGMMPWTFFSSSVQGGSTCIRAQADMVKKIYFPREVIPISYVTSTFVNMLFSFIIVFLAVMISGYGIDLKVIGYLPLIICTWAGTYRFQHYSLFQGSGADYRGLADGLDLCDANHVQHGLCSGIFQKIHCFKSNDPYC